VKDNAKVNGQNFQIMRCHICYKNLVHISNSKTQIMKGVINYNNNGIKKLKKCRCRSFKIVQNFEEEMNNSLKVNVESNLPK
jgi:uncharacterized protein YunC (DUF1805 family)